MKCKHCGGETFQIINDEVRCQWNLGYSCRTCSREVYINFVLPLNDKSFETEEESLSVLMTSEIGL